MKLLKFLIVFCFATFLLHETNSQSFPRDIVSATQNGNAVELAKYFNDKVEIILPSKSGVYSKEQAQFVMRDFFSSNRPTSFQINHEGKRDNSSFAIGRYVSAKEQFRFYFLTKVVDGKTVIIQIRIDKNDE